MKIHSTLYFEKNRRGAFKAPPPGLYRVKNGALDSDFMFVNIEPYKSKKCVPY